jgi:type I restriction enzyme S subunit
MSIELPAGWAEHRLLDICRPTQWPTISREKFTENGYAVFGANGQIGFYSEFNHPDETIAITCRGATCGTINIVPPRSYITGNAMALDSLATDIIDQKYLYQALKYWGVAKSITGSAQPQITRQSLNSVAFPFPPLDEQRRIAEVLRSVDEAIERQCEMLDQIANLNRSTARNFLLDPTQLPPTDAAVHQLLDICRPRQHPTISSKQLLPSGYPVFGANGRIGYFNKYTHEKSVIAITCRGATCGTVNWVPARSYITGNAMAIDDLNCAAVNERFLYHYLMTWGVRHSISGSAQPQITRNSLSCIRIVAPPVNMQKALSEVLDAQEASTFEERRVLDQLTGIKNNLSADLLSGRIRVPA